MLGEIASADYDTYSGYVPDQNGRIPQENEVFTTARFIVTVKTMDGNSISTYLFRY